MPTNNKNHNMRAYLERQIIRHADYPEAAQRWRQDRFSEWLSAEVQRRLDAIQDADLVPFSAFRLGVEGLLLICETYHIPYLTRGDKHHVLVQHAAQVRRISERHTHDCLEHADTYRMHGVRYRSAL